MRDSSVCTWPSVGDVTAPRLWVAKVPPARPPQPSEHLGRRMAVIIARANTDHRFARPQLAEPRVRGRGERAVMPHFEQLYLPDAPREVSFHRQSRVRLEQEAGRTARHPPPPATPRH